MYITLINCIDDVRFGTFNNHTIYKKKYKETL